MSKKRFTLSDLFMWVALAGLVAAVLAPAFRAGANNDVRSLAVSANGSTAAALFEDGTVRVWRTSDAALVATLPTGADDYSVLCLSGDGATIAVNQNGEVGGVPRGGIELWDVASQKRLHVLATPWLCDVALAPNGDRIVWTSQDGTVAVYETVSADSPPITLVAPAKGVRSVPYGPVFSPDGELLAIRHSDGEIVLFETTRYSVLAKLTVDDWSSGVMAFSPDGRKLAAAFDQSYCEFEATRRVGKAWDFSTAQRHSANLDDEDWGYVRSMAYLPDGQTLAATCGRLLLIDTKANKVVERRAEAFMVAASCRGNVLLTSDAEDVKLWDAREATVRQTLWRSSSVRFPLVVAGFVVWLLVFNFRKARKLVRFCHTCGRPFSLTKAQDASVECDQCRQRARLKTLTASQARREPWKRRLRGVGTIVGILAMLLLLRRGLSWDLAWLLVIPALLPAWMGLGRLMSYLKRRRTLNEGYDLRLAENCAAACGEVRPIGGLTVWSAAPSKLIDEIGPQSEICRQRLARVLGENVPPPDDARVLIFADHRGLARYLAELRYPWGSGPRFNGVYLFAPLKKMLIAERELFEQSADPLVRLRALVLYRLIEMCEPRLRQGWLANGLMSVLARDDGADELVRFARRTRAGLLAGRALAPAELLQPYTNRLIRRVRRHGDQALHTWNLQYNTQAWSLIEFLCGRGSTPERRTAFQRFWNDSSWRRNATDSLVRHYAMSLDDLFHAWREWAERPPPGNHQPPPSHLAAWMLREPIATLANTTAVRRNRIVAIRHLGELGFALGADRLIDVLRGDDPILREEAVWALECISGEVRGAAPADWNAWWQSLPDGARNVSTDTTRVEENEGLTPNAGARV